tara:strand:- start:1198 stop:1647 length:450 start_codon:yes stop_codon:yes gene_type:complete
MATIINGTNLKLKVDDSSSPSSGGVSTIAAATSCTCNLTIDVAEVSDKDSLDRKEFQGLSTSWTMDAEVFYNENGSVNPATLFERAYGDGSTATPNGTTYPTKVYVEFDGGSNEYHGEGYISTLSMTGGTEDAATYSVSIQGTGQLNKS